jgi:putative phosphoserine phosphatase/1-acylglycerol-3-phosphate O-acyltransferase
VNSYGQVTAEVDRAGKGATTAAFFDFDGTLIAVYSVSSFLKRRFMSGDMSPREMYSQLAAAWRYAFARDQFADTLIESAQALRGVTDESLAETARDIFEQDLAGEIFPECRALVRAHVARGHTVVIVSSATQYQVGCVAEELGIRHILCTELEVEDGVLTGGIVPPVCYGEGKRDAALKFAKKHRINLKKSFFYTDGRQSRQRPRTKVAAGGLADSQVCEPRPAGPHRRAQDRPRLRRTRRLFHGRDTGTAPEQVKA